MVIVVILLALAFLAVLAVILLRRAGGGRFPWLQFYMKGRESGFLFHEINLLRRVSIESKLENPTALFWSMKQLDRALKGTIIKYRARSQEQDPEYNHLLSKLFELRKRVEFDQPKYKMGIKSSRKLMPKQWLRITLPGLGPVRLHRSWRTSRATWQSRYPQGPSSRTASAGRTRRSGVYLWRAEDAGYFFQTKVLEDFIDRKYPILHIAHSDNLIRTQKRNSLRVETDIAAELFPLKSIDQASEVPEQARGCAAGWSTSRKAAPRSSSGEKHGSGFPSRSSSPLGIPLVVMSGVVKGITFDQKKNRSLLHMQAATPA